MTAANPADEQFRRALSSVREHPVDQSRWPLFSLPSAATAQTSRGGGGVLGLSDDIWATSEAIRAGTVSAADIVDRSLEQIEAHSARLGAFETTATRDVLLRALEHGDPAAPLFGIPVGVKDVIDAVGFPTTGSSAAIPPRQPAVEGQAVSRLRAAGAAIIGKTVTHEFALGVTTPQSHNPWDETRVPGGSSGGAVISLVTGMALGALGTDTRASIRVPAALSGAVGFRPTTGLVPIGGWMPLSWSMDVLAPMARSVRDIALLMDVLTEATRFRMALPGTLRDTRIGVSDVYLSHLDPQIAARFNEALDAIGRSGGQISELPGPTRDELHLSNVVGMILSRAEAAHAHDEAGTDIERCIPEVRDQLREARKVPAADYVRCMRIRAELYDRFLAAMDGVDFLVMPTSKVVAPLRDEAERFLLVLSENCITWSLLGFPAISVFAGIANGLPSGLQLVGRPGSDAALVAAAYAVEQALPTLPAWTS